ncbi:MAG: 50S ribosomal protein L10, partial [Chloroflexota bacterium]
MPTQKKIEAVAELSEALGQSGFTVLTDYRGLTVAQLQDLRRQLREHNAELRIAKNTLARIAAKENELDELEATLVGPTAIMFAYDDPAQPAK